MRRIAIALAAVAALVLVAAPPALRGGLLPPARAGSTSAPVRVLLDKDAAYEGHAGSLARGGMRVIADYGAFVLAEFPAGSRGSGLAAAGVRVRREVPEGVRLRRRLVTADRVRAAAPSPLAGGAHLVRLGAPARPAWVEAIRALPGSRILMTLPEDAYIVWLSADAIADLPLSGAPIEFAAPLAPSDRVSPDLDGREGNLDVTILFADNADGRAALMSAADRSLGAPGPAPRLQEFLSSTITISRDDLDEIAAWPGVIWIEPFERPHRNDEVSALITAGLLSGGRPFGPEYREWLSLHGLDDLSSFVVQVVDTGIDTGGTGAEHPAIDGRLAFAIDETGEGSLEDCVGHGTHIAGIIAGDPPPSADLHDERGFSFGLGVAPTARVGASRIFDCSGNFKAARPFTEIVAEAYRRGARLSNNSWGVGGASYTALAREFDALVRDANADPADGDQPMVVVASVGNKGNGPRSVEVPSLAKNVIAVGGTESYRPEGVDGCGYGPEGADDPDEIRTTSARGPTVDGRLKPDLLAPGSHIISLASRSAGYSGLGLCDTYYPPGQRLYAWTGGTSQSAAHVSGAAVLAMAHHEKLHGTSPSPAMVKAQLVASARDLGRFSSEAAIAVEHRPTNDQGWGRVDLTGLIGRRYSAAFDQTDLLTSAGQEIVKGPFYAADSNLPVSIVLAWTDAPGAPAGSAWVNDLDLEVAASGTTFLGNVIADGWSLAGGTHDSRNNVEAVFLPAAVNGRLHVKVTAVSIPGDGVPSRPGITDQDFALYIVNVHDGGSSGQVLLDQDAYSCGGSAQVVVVDRHLRGAGSLRVEASSGAEPRAEILELSEDPAGSGLFRGTLPLVGVPAASDGALQVSDGDRIAVAYHDSDAGSGSPSTTITTAHAACAPLVISDVRAESIGSDRARVAWRTSRPADSFVALDGAPSLHDPTMVTRHAILVDGLSGCLTYPFRVASSDASGVSATFPSSGSLFFSTDSTRRVSVLSDDFEALASRWTHSGSKDEWELGRPVAGPGRAYSGRRAWGTDLDGNYEEGADAVLVSPAVDLRGRADAVLSFQHYVDLPLAATPGDPQDGAWVEASLDDGATWTPIAPTTGYPWPAGPGNPYLLPNSGVFAGTWPGWIEARFDLTPFEGQVIRLRFHLWRGHDSASPPRSGWYIDDLSVTANLPCHEGEIHLDAPEYGCTGVVRVTVADTDLDTDPVRRDATSVTLAAASGSHTKLLTETTSSSGLFTGSVTLSPAGGAGTLRVSSGETITARYLDANDGSGSPATVEVSARIPDCTPPSPPSDFRVLPKPGGTLWLEWTDPPDADLSEVHVHYDSDGSGPAYSGDGAMEGASPVRSEGRKGEALLSGLPSCVPIFMSLTAVDALGNESSFSEEAIAVPKGSAPCPRAVIALSPAGVAGCSQVVAVRVDDSNADPNPHLPGALTVLATSPSDPSPLAISLAETGPATGSFIGSLPLTPSVSPGLLYVRPGDVIEVAYADADTGSGISSTTRAGLPVGECTPPAITGIRISSYGLDRIALEWDTDEPAASTVEYGLDLGVEMSVVDPNLTTHHSAVLTGLQACSPVYYRIRATDEHGSASVADDGGTPFHAESPRASASLFDDFETGAPGWSHGGAHDEWESGAPAVGPPGAYSGVFVWGTDLDGNYETGADLWLVSPDIDLTGLDSATLTFRHWYDIYSSSPGTGFDDGGWVEISRDGGATWSYVVPEGGYPDVIANNGYIPIGAGVYAGTTRGWETAVFRLDAFSGDHIRIRFHLFQDSVDVENPTRPGWYIDDVGVLTATACHQGRLHLDASRHDCGGVPIEVRLWDRDLDTSPAVPDSTSVSVVSTTDPSPLSISLTETGASTGAFLGFAPFGPAGVPGTLRVSEGDLVTVTYQDGDDGTGSPAILSATTRIGDCTPPSISGVTVEMITSGTAIVRWETNEPSTSEVRIHAAGRVIADRTLVIHHAVTVPGLAPCSPQLLEVASADEGGNLAVENAGGAFYPVGGMREIEILRESFESGAPGWTHGGIHDVWESGAPSYGPLTAPDGSGVAGTNLSGPYTKDKVRQSSASYLLSPWFSLKGAASPVLTFRHWFAFTQSTKGDGGILEGWNGTRWITLSPRGGYPGSLRVDRGGTLAGAFTDLSGGWISSTFDLDPLAGRTTRLRFRMVLDHGTPAAAPGWYLDQIRVTALSGCRRGLLLLDREDYACSHKDARILLADTDLNQKPAAVETVFVTARAGSSTVPVPLTETGSSTGLFTGSVDLSPAPAPGSLLAAEGDTLEVLYGDADDGTGTPRTVTAAAPIQDCAPPAVSGVGVDRIDDGTTLRLRWRTGEPATTEAALTIGSGPVQTISSADLTKGHEAVFPGLPDCTPFTLALASADGAGNRAEVGGSDPPLAGETLKRRILFRDDMEGQDPGWLGSGAGTEWERGHPTVGPPGPFSGLRAYATDLDGQYRGGTDAVLTSPPIALGGLTSATLTFWHFYDIFASGSPNADDDGAWVEILYPGASGPAYIQPIDSYSNTIDDAGPIPGGSGVYAGNCGGWRRAAFDLTPFIGSDVRVRFRLWNDVLEALINQATGFGWYLDDVEVTTPGSCFPAPTLQSAAGGPLVQGGAGVPLEVSGEGLRAPLVLDAGPGLTFRSVNVASSQRATTLVDVSSLAAAGPRDLRATTPDGQSSLLRAALLVEVALGRPDLDRSGAVDGRDLAIFARAFGTFSGETRYSPDADFNGDGVVDGSDLAIFGASFGRSVGP